VTAGHHDAARQHCARAPRVTLLAATTVLPASVPEVHPGAGDAVACCVVAGHLGRGTAEPLAPFRSLGLAQCNTRRSQMQGRLRFHALYFTHVHVHAAARVLLMLQHSGTQALQRSEAQATAAACRRGECMAVPQIPTHRWCCTPETTATLDQAPHKHMQSQGMDWRSTRSASVCFAYQLPLLPGTTLPPCWLCWL